MDVIHMRGKVAVVADTVLPKTPLPDPALLMTPAGVRTTLIGRKASDEDAVATVVGNRAFPPFRYLDPRDRAYRRVTLCFEPALRFPQRPSATLAGAST